MHPRPRIAAIWPKDERIDLTRLGSPMTNALFVISCVNGIKAQHGENAPAFVGAKSLKSSGFSEAPICEKELG